MREEYLMDGSVIYWNHDGIMEMVECQEAEDGKKRYFTKDGRPAKVRHEDDLCPLNSRIYKHFNNEHRRDKRNRR